MAMVWIPALLRDLTSGQDTIVVPGATVRQVIEGLDRLHPGIQARLCEGERMRPGIAAVIDAEVARRGLSEPVGVNSEVHFLPAVGGG